MRKIIANTLQRFARWIEPKAAAPTGSASPRSGGGDSFIDSYRRHRAPSSTDLLRELKNTAWTCASINASVSAANPPKLYVRTAPGDRPAKCRTKTLPGDHPLVIKHKAEAQVQEVLEHPLLETLKAVNEVHNSFDLWELTQLYQEAIGFCCWKLDLDPFLKIPRAIYVLPSQYVTPRRHKGSGRAVDFYEYSFEGERHEYSPEEIVHFRFPDPWDPYSAGMAPLRAAFEKVALDSQYTAMKRAIYDNTGMPSAILDPDEPIGEEERERYEEQWSQKFQRGGTGRVLVTDSKMRLQILSHSMGDLAALAEANATKEDIMNAFHVPVPYLSGNTNLANMEAAEIFHMRLAITPRLKRRDEKLNEVLIPRYDPTGRLFLASEDPTPASQANLLKQQEQDIRLGVRSINEVRIERGYPPVPWGETPFPMQPAQAQHGGRPKQEVGQ
jgi:HK97 family phage portal protein